MPHWLGGKRQLAPGENAEAIALASLKAVEILAAMMVKSNGLMNTDMMAAQFRFAAVQTSEQAKTHADGSLERAGLEFMATQLSDIADNLLKAEKEKNATDAN